MNYYGDVQPPVGECVYDPAEQVWVVRVRERDIEFPCGFECCGVQYPAVLGFETEEQAAACIAEGEGV